MTTKKEEIPGGLEVKPKIVVEYVGNARPAQVPRMELEREQDVEVEGEAEANIETLSKKVFEQRRKWPRACLRCGGDGGIANVPGGAGHDEIEIAICSGCLSLGKCPRCAATLPPGWREKVDNPVREENGKLVENTPARCAVCRWEDGDPPVLDVSEDR